MAKAKREGGLYYIGDTAVDAHGVAVEDAPKKKPNTDPSKQPGAAGASTPEERMGESIARALLKGTGRSKPETNEEDEDEEKDTTLPVLADLPAHLATLTTIEDVKALKKRDKRVGAQDAYAARLDELKS